MKFYEVLKGCPAGTSENGLNTLPATTVATEDTTSQKENRLEVINCQGLCQFQGG